MEAAGPRFAAVLAERLDVWRAAGKKGVWLTVPDAAAGAVGPRCWDGLSRGGAHEAPRGASNPRGDHTIRLHSIKKFHKRTAPPGGPAVAAGFAFHHAKPGYVLLTRWLPTDQPSPLPRYGFTQIGVPPRRGIQWR